MYIQLREEECRKDLANSCSANFLGRNLEVARDAADGTEIKAYGEADA